MFFSKRPKKNIEMAPPSHLQEKQFKNALVDGPFINYICGASLAGLQRAATREDTKPPQLKLFCTTNKLEDLELRIYDFEV